jgi:hypothetical protein
MTVEVDGRRSLHEVVCLHLARDLHLGLGSRHRLHGSLISVHNRDFGELKILVKLCGLPTNMGSSRSHRSGLIGIVSVERNVQQRVLAHNNLVPSLSEIKQVLPLTRLSIAPKHRSCVVRGGGRKSVVGNVEMELLLDGICEPVALLENHGQVVGGIRMSVGHTLSRVGVSVRNGLSARYAGLLGTASVSSYLSRIKQ